ncbi:Ubiquitin-like protein pmt3/smt3 [Psilocybe cubensis]|uniref:Ubiquitin-like protein pmt3/smt3 n=2 Tax=Psilocybe cubensis TaxID=181762 RepID=A0ACB8GIG5_PSICU|nr:Ubiquitin-like protein pmt3/smt3 [Psilocybe cubensis]KAH9475289.1 Ubiquitin-like protein pmt3/smt3 [Psilocybe cubensis]
MSEEDHQANTQEHELKQEDANATINIKVRRHSRKKRDFGEIIEWLIDVVNSQVVSSSGEEVFFKIKRSTRLSKLQGAYASKVGKDVGSIRFLYDGSRIQEDDTPATLDMEDNDTIDVMVEQVGGSLAALP